LWLGLVLGLGFSFALGSFFLRYKNGNLILKYILSSNYRFVDPRPSMFPGAKPRNCIQNYFVIISWGGGRNLLDNKAIGGFNDGFCIYAYTAHLFVKYFF
jgi:hypothetical protein